MKYRTIYADPPWMERGGGKIKRGADRHYPLMKTSEIIDYMKRIETEKNAHLWLWATNNHLPDALEVIRALGFAYKTNLVWVKDRFGLGQYVRMRHELLLFATKGTMPYKNRVDGRRWKTVIDSVITAKRTKHSRKPSIVYPIIETISYPPYLEVFARTKYEGWDTLGNEEVQTILRKEPPGGMYR